MLRKLSQLLIDLTVCNLDILFKNLRSKNRKEIRIIAYFFYIQLYLCLLYLCYVLSNRRFKQGRYRIRSLQQVAVEVQVLLILAFRDPCWYSIARIHSQRSLQSNRGALFTCGAVIAAALRVQPRAVSARGQESTYYHKFPSNRSEANQRKSHHDEDRDIVILLESTNHTARNRCIAPMRVALETKF